MSELSTDKLEKVLRHTHIDEAEHFLDEQKDSFFTMGNEFSSYMRTLFKEKGMLQQRVFLEADISERYGYKLITGEKRTRQRDIILRLCYAGHLTLEETQKALKIYEMPQLYAKIPRDALIMIALNERPGSIIEVNAFLQKHGVEILRSSGVKE